MRLPFTPDEFFDVFRRYNEATWPAQWGLVALAIIVVGAALIAYAIIIYPALGYHWGHRYPANPTFGVPCPTTIFALGLIVWASRSIPRRLAIVPLAWAVVGTSAALNLGVLEDFGLLAAAVLTGWMLIAGRHGAIINGRRPAPAAR